MSKTLKSPIAPTIDTPKSRIPRVSVVRRAHSNNVHSSRVQSPSHPKKPASQRRCQSLSPSVQQSKNFSELSAFSPPLLFDPRNILEGSDNGQEKEPLPQSVVAKMARIMATKRREFFKQRKSLITLQNSILEQYAALRDLESRVGAPNEETLGDVRLVSVSGWTSHDLLMLVRDDLELPISELSGIYGPQVIQQLHAQLTRIPEEVLSAGAEVMARRIDLLNLLRGKRCDRTTSNLEWKTKNSEFDAETENLHRMLAGLAENLKARINYSLELAKIPWLDREAILKKIERLQRENLLLNHKLEEVNKKDSTDDNDQKSDSTPKFQALQEELCKERAAREALKEVVSAAESMLRVARARNAALERQLKEMRVELETARRKHKDLEQLYRHRETTYDARSRKLLEVSKTGEITIETLSRQRDALEQRVKELHEQMQAAEKIGETLKLEHRSRTELLQAKVAEQAKDKTAAENRVVELDARVKELEEQYNALRERSVNLVDVERRRCLEYVPSKESEPTDRETELFKELQATRLALSRAEEELRQSRADKDSFLNSLTRIAQGGDNSLQDQMAKELLEREQKLLNMQNIIDEQKENEKLMEQSMTQYENELAALRLEVKRLKNYDVYSKEIPYGQMQTEMLELHMQVETLTRERTALASAAASKALMLERHERSADLFARILRARRDLAAYLEGRVDTPAADDVAPKDVSRSLFSMCADAADTWSALRYERGRVIRLESAVLAQSLQLEREGRVRTQLERRRAILEREILKDHQSTSSLQTDDMRPYR